MDTLNLDDLEKDLSFLKVKDADTKIPIPSPDYLKKIFKDQGSRKDDGRGRPFEKEREYDAFCKWLALPKELRKPKTVAQFEDKWGLSRSYTEHFKEKEDFQQRRLQYFWEWMMDLFPDVVYAIYKRAIKNSSVDSRAFAEIILKKLDVEKPRINVSPMMIMGVPQEKIDALFIPKEYESVKEILPISKEK